MAEQHPVKKFEFSLEVSKDSGSVSVAVFEPEDIRAVLVIGHGAGAGMNHPFLYRLADELSAKNIVTIRYNFPYMERRRRMPDRFPVAAETIRKILSETHIRYPVYPIYAGGKSFGGRMTSQALAEDTPSYIRGIVFFGFPLHPPGKPSVMRAEHLQHITVPMLFLQGTKDTLASAELISEVHNGLPLSTLVNFEGADHSFKSGKQTSIEGLTSATIDWINTMLE